MHAETTYVDRFASGSVHDGSSWCHAYLTVQDALVPAVAGTTIRVADGTYTPDQGGGQTPGDRYATFQLKNGVTLEGGYAGCGAPDPDARDIAGYETILSGDLNGNDTPVPCKQSWPDCISFGGCVGGLCIYSDNSLENSYHVTSGIKTDPTALIDGFTISSGMADGRISAQQPIQGAGMYNINGSPIVSHCTFRGNHAPSGSGGGMWNSDSSPTVTNCTFSGNSALYEGGGMGNSASSPTVTNCVFSGNRTTSVGDTGGGGMSNFSSSPTLTNCTFSGNAVNYVGGGMFNYSSNPTVINCTFSGNSASEGGAVVNCCGAGPNSATISGCILWGNTYPQIRAGGSGSTAVVNYSIVQGGWSGAGGVGVLDADPLFVDADGPDDVPGTEDDDLRLMAGSPAIDAGDTTALPPDVADLDGDGDTAERTPLDLAGNPRVLNDPATPDSGVPGPGIVDMGAYEFRFGSCCDLLSGTCVEGLAEGQCAGTLRVWSDGATCEGVACEAVTGACCDHDPIGPCTDGVTQAACDCAMCEWVKGSSCAELDCLPDSIPTVNTWGLIVITLLLLTSAKLRFGRAEYLSN